MGPGRSTEAAAARPATLGALARASIEHGLERHVPLPVAVEDLLPAHAAPGASFVTLTRSGALRGCVGSLEAHRPLARDVAHNAFAAAFHDLRFAPLVRDELAELEVRVSVLGPLERLAPTSEAELLAALRPGVDGLVLAEGARRATFLPAVWDQLPEPRRFLEALRCKAGLPPDYWSGTLEVHRYDVRPAD